eukprot:m.11861 g.11861  ORF g.11861 m.11861 type:complete len:443 (+) comp5972_c0_seq1:187-1515(+)
MDPVTIIASGLGLLGVLLSLSTNTGGVGVAFVMTACGLYLLSKVLRPITWLDNVMQPATKFIGSIFKLPRSLYKGVKKGFLKIKGFRKKSSPQELQIQKVFSDKLGLLGYFLQCLLGPILVAIGLAVAFFFPERFSSGLLFIIVGGTMLLWNDIRRWMLPNDIFVVEPIMSGLQTNPTNESNEEEYELLVMAMTHKSDFAREQLQKRSLEHPKFHVLLQKFISNSKLEEFNEEEQQNGIHLATEICGTGKAKISTCRDHKKKFIIISNKLKIQTSFLNLFFIFFLPESTSYVIDSGESFILKMETIQKLFGKKKAKQLIKDKISSLFSVLSSDMRQLIAGWVWACVRDYEPKQGDVVFAMRQVGRSKHDPTKLIIPYLAVKIGTSKSGWFVHMREIKEVRACYQIVSCKVDNDSIIFDDLPIGREMRPASPVSSDSSEEHTR